jgi:hypothetical protein
MSHGYQRSNLLTLLPVLFLKKHLWNFIVLQRVHLFRPVCSLILKSEGLIQNIRQAQERIWFIVRHCSFFINGVSICLFSPGLLFAEFHQRHDIMFSSETGGPGVKGRTQNRHEYLISTRCNR